MARVQQNYRMVGGATAGLFPAVEQQLANGGRAPRVRVTRAVFTQNTAKTASAPTTPSTAPGVENSTRTKERSPAKNCWLL